MKISKIFNFLQLRKCKNASKKNKYNCIYPSLLQVSVMNCKDLSSCTVAVALKM